jgi:hypothetical protein
VRELDEETMEVMVSQFTTPEPEARALLLHQVEQMLTKAPDQIFVFGAWKGELLVGFVIAESNPLHVFISQLWSNQGNPPTVADRLFLQVLIWAQGLGRTKIIAETRRDLEAMHRRAGFTERSILVEYDMAGFSKRLLAHAREAFQPQEVEEVVDG